MPLKVAVIDDTDHVRQMLVTMLALDGFDVVAEGSGGGSAVAIALEHDPDVIVIDYSMPGMNGLDASRRVLEYRPQQNIILYSAYIDDLLKEQARAAGVAICVGKVDGIETLERSISELCLRMGKRI